MKYLIFVFLFLKANAGVNHIYGNGGLNLISGPSIGVDYSFMDSYYLSTSTSGLFYVMLDYKLLVGIQKVFDQDILRFGFGFNYIIGQYLADAPKQNSSGVVSQLDIIHNWKKSSWLLGIKIAPSISYLKPVYSKERVFYGGLGLSLIFGK